MAETLSYADDGFDQPDSVELTSAENISGASDATLDTDYDNVWNSDSVADVPSEKGGDSLVWEVSGGGSWSSVISCHRSPSSIIRGISASGTTSLSRI